MQCKLNDKCEFGDLCQQATRHDSITVLGCSSYKSKKPLTNEEWLKKANTEQLAEFLIVSIKKCKSCASGIGFDEIQHCPFGECGCHFKGEVIKWLEQPHGGSKNEMSNV